MGAVTNEEPLFDTVSAAAREFVNLRQQHRRVDHHALAEHAARRLPQDAARQQPHNDFFVPYYERMARIGATPISNHPVRTFRVDVDNFPLPFVTPLGTNDYDC